MGFLDNDTVVVDAILTKHGRKLLSEGMAINPSHFALSDDGIDYTLWNESSPSGSDGYDDYITMTPLIEAIPDDSVMMRYTLMTLNQNTRYMPVLNFPNDPSGGSQIYTLDNDIRKKDIVKLEPEIKNVSDATAPKFDFYIMDASALTVSSHDGIMIGMDGSGPQTLEQSVPYPVLISDATHLHLLDLRVTQDFQTIVRVVHVGTGATGIVTVKVLKSDTV